MTELFAYCPACGGKGISFESNKRYFCTNCGFEYFHNVATAAGVFIISKGRLLTLVRAQEPGKGLLGLPGGFVDPGERVEDAVRRECREEVGFEPDDIDFLCSFPNEYHFRGMLYHTCDLYFTHRNDTVELNSLSANPEEVSKLLFTPLEEVDPLRFAFPAARKAWNFLGKTVCFHQSP